MSAIEKKNTPQIDKFRQAARELECDNDEKRFKERLSKLAKQKAAEGRD